MTPRRPFLLTSTLLAFALGGCPQGPTGGNGGNSNGNGSGGGAVASMKTLTVKGKSRSYALHVPSSYSGDRTPLVLVLHGTGYDGKSYLDGNGWADKSESAGFIVAAPNARPADPTQPANLLTNPTLWDFSILGGGGNDIEFIDSLITKLSAQYNIDVHRIYVAGHSSGGGMAFLLGIMRNQTFAAIGVVASPFIGGLPNLGIPMPTIYIQGTDDPVVPVTGGGSFFGGLVPPLEITLSGWAAVLGCTGDRTVDSDQHGVEKSSFSACTDSVQFKVILIDGQGHQWPGGSVPAGLNAIIGPASGKLDATNTIWSFFKGKSK